MIKLIGLKRITALFVLLGINILVFSGYLFALTPMLEDARARLRTVEGQVKELQGKIASAKQDVVFVNENLPKYQELQDKGLFLEQDRFMIDRMLQEMRTKAEVDKFSFTVDALANVPNADAESIGYNLVSSRINLDKIAAPLDNNIYDFLQNIGKAFPDHTRLQKFSVRRIAKVEGRFLDDISMGKPVSFVNASVAFDWMTLAPKPDDKASGATGSGGR